MDKEYLAQLRANAAEVRADLSERELRDLEDHEAIMAATDIVTKGKNVEIVHKTVADAKVLIVEPDEPPMFSDEQLDVMAAVLAQTRADLQAAIDDATAPLRERIAVLEGQISMMVNLLGGDKKSFEATETVRKLRLR